MSSLAERKNQQIWDALEGNNVKQALQLCMKRIKKGEKGDYIQALRTYILTQWPSAAYKRDGYLEAKALAEKDPPITDLETLSLLRKSFANLDDYQSSELMTIDTKHYVTILWERALKANPGDENLARECFFSYLEQCDWGNAQKTAMTLQRVFSKKRDYYFWAVLCCHLHHTSSNISEAERKLFGNLAYKMISKAASEVSADPQVLLNPGRSISTPQELHLLITITRKQNETAEALRILDSPNLGISSSVAKGDWSFVCQKLEILEEQKRWHDVWAFCKTLLVDASPTLKHDDKSSSEANTGDDWRIWKAFIHAATEINKPELTDETETIMKSYLSKPPVGRNALLARLHFSRAKISSENSQEAPSRLLSSCKKHFEDAATMVCCYDDLRDTIELLDVEAQQALLNHAEEICEQLHSNDQSDKGTLLRWISARANELKLRFHLRISQLNQSEPTQEVVNFINASISLYKLSLSAVTAVSSNNNPGKNACILAAMALVHLSRLEKRAGRREILSPRLLQAAALLEFLISHSEPNYQALLILVRIYGILGCGSLAFRSYSRLSIKNVQHDTISHNLFTRISTLHPWPVANTTEISLGKEDQDPSLGLQRAQKIYTKAEDQISRMVKLAVEQGSYNHVPGFLALGEKLDKSICKFMYDIESRRILRFLTKKGSAPAVPYEHAHKMALLDLSDNRDDGVMLNFERSKGWAFEEHIRIGPKPGEQWVKAFTTSEQLMGDAISHKDGNGEITPDIANTLERRIKELRDICAMKDTATEFTAAELSYLALCVSVYQYSRSQLDESVNKKALGATSLEEINEWLKAQTGGKANTDIVNGLKGLGLHQNMKVPSWETLHNAFTTLDALKMIGFMLHEKTPRGRIGNANTSQATLSYTKELVTGVYEEVRSRIVGFTNSLSESSTNELLIDSILGKEDGRQDLIGAAFEELMSASWIEAFAVKVINSWQEALDGVLRVKVL